MRIVWFAPLTAVFFLIFAWRSFAAEGFSSWLEDVRREAARQGISQKTIAAALSDVQYAPRIELDRKQPESRQAFAEYRNNLVNAARVEKGRRLYKSRRVELVKAARRYGVAPEMIVALWGMETNYGANTGGFDVIEALATLAYDGRRSDFFRGELFGALQIVDEGDVRLPEMKGSWAGAMGQNQFMPSSFHKFAVDGDGDGRRDIWRSLPDVFASTANYLSQSGWRNSQIWGREVRLSQNIPESIANLDAQKSMIEWSRMGVTLPDGGGLPTSDGMYASLILPDGQGGPAFLVYDNFRIIMKWNRSIYFATSVGLLADEIARADFSTSSQNQ